MIKLPPKHCKNCGCLYTPKRITQCFCSDNCRKSYYAVHYYHRTVAFKECPNCGNEFETTRPNRQIYCSEECRIQAMYKRKYGNIDEVGNCELCGEHYKLHEYKGLKLCTKCEYAARFIDSGLVGRYLDLANL